MNSLDYTVVTYTLTYYYSLLTQRGDIYPIVYDEVENCGAVLEGDDEHYQCSTCIGLECIQQALLLPNAA